MKGSTKVSSAFAVALLASSTAPTLAQAASVTIQSGDTLSAIAKANQTTVENLVNSNGITNANLIYPNQQIQVSGDQEASEAVSTKEVTLQNGDSLWKLSQEYGVSVQAIAKANQLSSIYALIHPGQVLVIPADDSVVETASATTTQTVAPVQENTVSPTTTPQPAQTTQVSQSGQDQGTFKLSFYDPAVLGSNMGYGGVAANLSVFPKGTRLKITLSDGTVWYRTVNDTGTFAYSNPRQLDVAMPNNQIPSAGILYANVEVLN